MALRSHPLVWYPLSSLGMSFSISGLSFMGFYTKRSKNGPEQMFDKQIRMLRGTRFSSVAMSASSSVPMTIPCVCHGNAKKEKSFPIFLFVCHRSMTNRMWGRLFLSVSAMWTPHGPKQSCSPAQRGWATLPGPSFPGPSERPV